MKDLTYESAMKKLEEIVSVLENGKLSLDESVKLFEQGAELSKFCNEQLKNAENKILSLESIENENKED